MTRRIKIFFLLIIGILVIGLVLPISLPYQFSFFQNQEEIRPSSTSMASTFLNDYYYDGIISEVNRLEYSRDPFWWLDSGGQLILENSLGKTFQGDLPPSSYWRKIYSLTSPIDTDGGKHPQNIFRLRTKTKWLDMTQRAYFKVNKDNLSSSPNRNESNGLFFFSRFQDSDNLYYAGLRVDGFVVVKKKYQGIYYTLAIVPSYIGPPYDRNRNPSLIPKNTWIGLKMETKNLPSGGVYLKICLDNEWTGNWVCPLDVIDNGKNAPVLNREGLAGIRTDFMDVEFFDYEVELK